MRGPRHHVLLFDGTWMSAARSRDRTLYTNVFEINLLLERQTLGGEPQFRYYYPGIASQESSIPSIVEGASARSLLSILETAYVNLAANYDQSSEHGPDKIYLFGFSRGAFVAQLLAALISDVGLLQAHNIKEYLEVVESALSVGLGANISTSRSLSSLMHRNCAIEYLGTFDPVLGTYFLGEYGESLKSLAMKSRLLPGKVRRALQLHALDEHRKDYREVTYQGVTDGSQSVLEQVWMPGAHADIGGGYSERAIADVALQSMVKHVHAYTRLALDRERVEGIDRSVAESLAAVHTKPFVIHDEAEGSLWRRLLWETRSQVKRSPFHKRNHQFFHECAFGDILYRRQDYGGRISTYEFASDLISHASEPGRRWSPPSLGRP